MSNRSLRKVARLQRSGSRIPMGWLQSTQPISPLSEKVNPNQLLFLPYATAESHQRSKEMTSRDKSTSCARSIRMLKLSEILEAVSTSKDAGFKTYWTDFSREISSNLLLPTGIDSVDSASKRCNTWWNKTVVNSWFSTSLFTVRVKNSPLICFQSCMSSVAGCPDSADIVTKSRKIPLLLTCEQKKTLRFWAAGKRAAYNETLKYLQRYRGKSPHWKTLKPKILRQLPNCYKTVPYQIKGDAVREAWQAVRNAKLKSKQTGEKQDIRYQSRRMSSQSLFIPASAIRENGIYPTILGDIEYAEPLPAPIAEKREKGEPKPIDEIRDSRLICEDGSWYLCITYNAPKHSSPTGAMRVVALDPGVRDFLTYFSETRFGWLGHQAINRIQRLCVYLDRLLSRIATCTIRRKKRTMRRAANQIRRRIRNLVKELHCKLVRFLVSNFDVILLPSFDTSQMTPRGSRRIRKKSVRQMLTLSHYKFKQRLLDKASQHGKHVIIVNEAYTSKTVSWTGEVNRISEGLAHSFFCAQDRNVSFGVRERNFLKSAKNLGGSKIITATDGSSMHRDLNGARGVLVRFLTWIHALLDEACPT